MCDQTMPYAPGAYVWVKLVNKVWWPGVVVKQSDVPEHVLNAYVNKKRNPIAIVHFKIDNSFEVVTKMDKVCLYASVNKMEFVEKGYNEYTKQKKGQKIKYGFDMSNFLEDVVNIEQCIGGDIHIFRQFENENAKNDSIKPSINVKDLFLTSKQLKDRERKLSSTFNKTAELKKSYTKQTKTVMPKNKPSTSQTVGGHYICYIKDGCTFSTNKYENLKRHTDGHKNEKCTGNEIPKTNKTPSTRRPMLNNDSPELPLPKKRRYVKSNKKLDKNIKLQEEILKDWDDVEDQDENFTLNDYTNLEVPTDVSSKSNKIDENITLNDNTNLEVPTDVSSKSNKIDENITLNDNTNLEVPTDVSSKSNKIDENITLNDNTNLEVPTDVSSKSNKIDENITLNDNTNLEVSTDVSSKSNKIFDFDESNSKCSSENEIPIYSPKSKRLVDEIETTLDDNSTTLNELDKFVKEANDQIQKITEVNESSIDSYNEKSILAEESEIIMEENNVVMPSLKQTTSNDNNGDKSSSNVDDSQPISNSQLDPTVQGKMCMDTVPLANSTKQSDNEPDTWTKFVRNKQDEVKRFIDIESPRDTLKMIMTAEKEAISPVLSEVDPPNLVDFKIQPSGPPQGYERIEVWAPFVENASVDNEASNSLKIVQKLLKEGQHNIGFNLNCKIIRHLT